MRGGGGVEHFGISECMGGVGACCRGMDIFWNYPLSVT